MQNLEKHYINGQWVDSRGSTTHEVINPATETPIATVRLGSEADADAAVNAAKTAFSGFSQSSKEERLALLDRIIEAYTARYEDLAQAVSQEMGAPIKLARDAHVAAGLGHFHTMRAILDGYAFEQARGSTLIRREPVGVCALITPWNWPLNQISCKVAPALAAGCTMVLKPSEFSPVSAHVLTEVMHEAGVPAGVFNLVDGDGATVGNRLSGHPDVDCVSFTGSTRAGSQVSRNAADTVKRVALELGGKSANIILDHDDFENAVARSMKHMLNNTGQSCNAPSRMLVPAARMEEAARIAADVAKGAIVGDPRDENTQLGPLANANQWQRVRDYIATGVSEGAQLVTGGAERPAGIERGYYVQPTVFANVNNEMRIAREEIFGPVLSIIPFRDENEAVQIANDTPYGLSGYVWGEIDKARAIAARLRTGNVHLNGAPPDFTAPFGGYGQSGIGREWGEFGLEEFLEVKAVLGYAQA